LTPSDELRHYFDIGAALLNNFVRVFTKNKRVGTTDDTL